MINKPPPFKGLILRILTIIPIKGKGSINRGSGLIEKRFAGAIPHLGNLEAKEKSIRNSSSPTLIQNSDCQI